MKTLPGSAIKLPNGAGRRPLARWSGFRRYYGRRTGGKSSRAIARAEVICGDYSEFKDRFYVPIQVFQDKEKTDQLKRLTAPFILRRLKTDKSIVPDLPEKHERKTSCYLTKEQATLYAAVVENATDSIDESSGMKRKSLVLTTLLRLKQICDHPALFIKDKSRMAERSGKLKRLAEMSRSIIDAGERILIFTQFTQMGGIIQQHLQNTLGKEVLFLHGGIERSQRVRMVERFQSAENGPLIFVLSLKAGGTGLNLTAANHVFHFDRWWNPAVEDQATDRASRTGQTSNVQVHKISQFRRFTLSRSPGRVADKMQLPGLVQSVQARGSRVPFAGGRIRQRSLQDSQNSEPV